MCEASARELIQTWCFGEYVAIVAMTMHVCVYPHQFSRPLDTLKISQFASKILVFQKIIISVRFIESL